jgi:hypothetical protein
MKTHYFSNQELRQIIFGKTIFRKCPACDGDGQEYWDENGCPSLPYPLPEWGNNYVCGDCEQCDGLGYTLFPANGKPPHT